MENNKNTEWYPTIGRMYNTEDGKSHLTLAQKEKYKSITDRELRVAFMEKCERDNRTPEFDNWLKTGAREGLGFDIDEL